MSLKDGGNVVCASNSLDSIQTLLGVSSGSKLFTYGTIVVSCGLGVNEQNKSRFRDSQSTKKEATKNEST